MANASTEKRQQPDVACVIHCQLSAKLNLAAHESAFPVLRDLRVENAGMDRLENLELTLESSPPFVHAKSWPIDRVEAESVIRMADRDLRLNGDFLRELTESTQGEVRLRLKRNGTLLAESVKPIELLASNEWGGAASMPELLAAFCTPNDPAVDGILRSASEVLRQAGKPDQIDGYHSGSRQRVWEMASAIYTAVANLGLSYALPPASFEEQGQKVRLPSRILEGKVATCLDTAMLFASVFEQAGFNPIVAMPKEHAMVGIWLQPEELATVVIDEAETLRKRIDLQELLLLETTCATASSAPPFSAAIDLGKRQIHHDLDDTFVAAIDIRQARAQRIRPLGVSGGAAVVDEAPASQVQSRSLEAAPQLPDFDSPEPEDAKPETPQGRLERWQRKLLDLSARNPLLNHRGTRASLGIICPDPGLLEDKLASGAKIQLQPLPAARGAEQDDLPGRQPTDPRHSAEYARAQLDESRVLVDLPEDELRKRTVEIFRKSQTALQEGGANTLYLALGFLLWKRNEKDERRFRAPLVLLPVALERRSVRSGVRMTAHDDEPRFNTTLLEMLRKDFQLDIRQFDDGLPEDGSGIDVARVWNLIRREVRDIPGFEVVEEVALGHFSFAKYLMWKDLADRTDALRENSVVRHLLDTPRDVYAPPGQIGFADPKRLDEDFAPADLLMPLPADASQMAVVATADRGKDFVIIGPPGTGKSQTIANLIAHMLGTGKTVLFVSEKTAALEVVYRRLQSIGLDRFCLELHSNKARKADVLAQLRKAWERGEAKSEPAWRQQASTLGELRDDLNRFVRHMHRKWPNGFTPHRAIGVKVRDEALAERVRLSWPAADCHDEGALNAMREVAENLEIHAQAVGDLANNPLALVEREDWTPSWQRALADQAVELLTLVDEAERQCGQVVAALGISVPDALSGLSALGELARTLADSHQQQTVLALGPDGRDKVQSLGDAASELQGYIEAKASLSCNYAPFAWRQLDGEDIRSRWVAAQRAPWLLRWFKRRALLRRLREGGAAGDPNLEQDAEALARLRRHGEALDRLDRPLGEFRFWRQHDTDLQALQSMRELGERVRAAIAALAETPQALAKIQQQVKSMLAEGNEGLAPNGTFGRQLRVCSEGVSSLAQAWAAFEADAGRAVPDAHVTLHGLRDQARGVAEGQAGLRDWCAWRQRRAEAVECDLLPLVEAVEAGRMPPGEFAATFEAAYCAWWSEAVMTEDAVLRAFSTLEHEARIRKFCAADDRHQQATAEYVAARLQAGLPAQDEVTRSSGWGIVRRELQKQRRHKPVRVLLKEAPDVLTKLTPCFMMSPLSVAQYLSTDQALFDVVIFDEASQITVWDAIGAIARGKQVIVAGDPKQMPPTNFFARADDDPDGELEIEGDLESILDEMLGASVPEQRLNLHYRSRRESLVAFSNARYYDNRLITFPAPHVKDSGLSVVRPSDGFYARGGARHNEAEAKAVTEEIVRRLTHEDASVRKQSIGVVTFNSEQQTLIEDLLDRERLHRPEIEWAFSPEETQEPVFVKNLETVQGDERDLILFSVTYGPDQSGRVTMNFGPLNREGGERRLNVAVTRSKSEMMIFSTLRPDQIDLSRTQARAVADLKDFLDYAERGAAVLGVVAPRSVGDADSPFEAAVTEALRRKGWRVQPQIGVSAYRIDLGVVHPDHSGRYLAGIECDGAAYHSSAVARERDKVRQQVLEGLGWTLFRIWSTDWWTNKAAALETVDGQLRECLEQDRRRRKEDEAAPTVEPQTCEVLGGAEQIDGRYMRSSLETFPADPESFHFPEYEPRLTAMLDHVVATEGPIHEDVLVRRIARHHGFQRSGR